VNAARERILVVGGGGREHALCWRIHHDRPEAQLFAAPGNGGIGLLATLVPLAASDIAGIATWCREERPDLVVVGPDEPLALGLVDALAPHGIRAFGPTAAAARIESSKAWAVEVGRAAGLPMPASWAFDSADEADAFVATDPGPCVVKADGLALGKGVFVCDDPGEAREAIDRLMRRREAGAAGERIVIQERLAGPELSVFAISDGRVYRIIGAARDHKRLGDGDAGPNTGGMGAFSPVPDVDDALLDEVGASIIGPALDELAARGTPFVGFLYAGLMLTDRGPVVIEFNSRLGDPEAQVLLPRLRFDLVDAMCRVFDGSLADWQPAAPEGAAVCVVLASSGYPGRPEVGRSVGGLTDVAAADPGRLLFHAGTRQDGGGWMTSGGRVLGVTGLGMTLEQARANAYAGVDAISFEGAQWRSDIAAHVGRAATLVGSA
jgi:phosphoribosylamine--glycine ligase